ncbi:MAG: DMT family transporter [Vannielia sp.]|uniref:DMT family transporter n=1 Tax=Rhodobacterales TaxID=204455 RepID=UPI0020941838|nr:DMT family transporter [Oceanicola sp. 502str15]MCO6382960.1 EamA family transporter [Oceanicola sp. 502str15]
MQQADRPLLGITLMLGFCLLAPLGDATAKLLGGHVPLSQLVFFRFAIQAAILVPVVLLAGGALRMSRRALGFTALRTLLHIVGIGSMFLSLRFLPLADAVAIAFVMPFFMLLLGWFFLGEEVGVRRLTACAVGFVGTCMVIQPSFVEVGWAALLPVLVAVNFSFFMLVTRMMRADVDPVAMQSVSGLMGTAVLAPLLLIADGTLWAEFDVVSPAPRTWVLIAAMGCIGTMAHLLMTWSLRHAPTATLAPMQYLEIPFSALIGWMIFKEFPNGLALAGIGVTMGAGLYIIWREQMTGRQNRQVTRPAPPAA